MRQISQFFRGKNLPAPVSSNSFRGNHQPASDLPPVTMSAEVMRLYRESIAKNPPETFALLGGRLDHPFHITEFYFLPPIKSGGSYVQSSGFVYPDHDALNYIIDRAFVPNGKYMLGLWHSHPGGYDTPSAQDFDYCSRIIASDDSPGRSWRYFLAPITTFTPSGTNHVSAWILRKGGPAFYQTEIEMAAAAPTMPLTSTTTAIDLPAPRLPSTEPADAIARLSEALQRRANTVFGMEAYHLVAKLNQMTMRLDE